MECTRESTPNALNICTIEVIDQYGPTTPIGPIRAGTMSGPMPSGHALHQFEDAAIFEGHEFVLFLGEPDQDGVRRPVDRTWGVVMRGEIVGSQGREYGFLYGGMPLHTSVGAAVRWDSWVRALDVARTAGSAP